ncbi:MAG TPA: hypothetical protein VM686_04335, partial [Polyangiaceae bacterium]|nr:hypothetical protein [Polyangiaceae bacterium]
MPFVLAALALGCGVDGEFAAPSEPARPPGHAATPPNLVKPAPELRPGASGTGDPSVRPAPEFAPVPPQSLICGDNVPGTNEQCDSGKPNDFCTAGCRARDTLAVPTSASDPFALNDAPH